MQENEFSRTATILNVVLNYNFSIFLNAQLDYPCSFLSDPGWRGHRGVDTWLRRMHSLSKVSLLSIIQESARLRVAAFSLPGSYAVQSSPPRDATTPSHPPSLAQPKVAAKVRRYRYKTSLIVAVVVTFTLVVSRHRVFIVWPAKHRPQ